MHRPPAIQYTLDTGEPFKDAVRRLAKTCSLAEAARILGYATGASLVRGLKAYGLEDVEFKGPETCVVDGVEATIKEHADRYGLNLRTVYWRLRKWGPCERVFKEPMHECGKRVTS